MVKRFICAFMAGMALCAAALGEITVEREEGEAYFPDEKNWVYHFTYAYPKLKGEDYTAALINDAYETALSEMKQLVLPMFANAPDMRYDGKNEVTHDFEVTCNNGRVLSILERRMQTRGQESPVYTLDPSTFDVSGSFAGETLTLRGTALILAGVDPAGLEDEEHPETDSPWAPIAASSSALMARALLPVLYEEFKALQETGEISPALTYEDFEGAFSPAQHFYADDQNRLVFFFPPMLLSEPSFQVPVFPFALEEVAALL